MSAESLLTRLVRDPAGVVDGELAGEGAGRVMPLLLGVVVVGAATFGGAMGAFHGGVQTAYAAVKLPFVLLVPALLTLPAIRALAHLYGLDLGARRVAAAGLVAVARIALVALAFAPLMWLAARALRYEAVVLTAVALLGVAGLAGTAVLVQAPRAATGLTHLRTRRFTYALGTLAVFAVVAGQSGWMLRPFVLRRPLTAGFIEAPQSDIFTELGARVRPGARPDGRPPRPEPVP